jgi:anti-anti-sigma factor
MQPIAANFGTRTALLMARRRTAELTLRITTQETEQTMAIKMEGRIAGPWVVELTRTWTEAAARRGTRAVLIDLSDVTYADESGKRVLRGMYAESGAKLVTSTPWTQFLAEEISRARSSNGDAK